MEMIDLREKKSELKSAKTSSDPIKITENPFKDPKKIPLFVSTPRSNGTTLSFSH